MDNYKTEGGKLTRMSIYSTATEDFENISHVDASGLKSKDKSKVKDREEDKKRS